MQSVFLLIYLDVRNILFLGLNMSKLLHRIFNVMKVLSLTQPWASMLAMGVKKIETRTWTISYRGDLLIHASKSKAGRSFIALPSVSQYITSFNSLPLGVIIGQARLVDIVPAISEPLSADEDPVLEENAFGDRQKVKYHWLFEEAVLFDSYIPATGRLGLWEW